MLDKIKSEILNLGLKFISVDEKIVRLFLETSPSNVNEIVILPAVKMVMKKIIKKLQNKRVYGRVYNGTLNNVRVSVIRSLMGAPNCAITLECLKRCKTKSVIRIDFCGGVENQTLPIKIGDILIPKIAYCDEGTSPQYIRKFPSIANEFESINNPVTRYQTLLSGNQTIFISKPDEILKEILLTAGRTLVSERIKEINLWTTDALFCETTEFLRALQSIDVHAIDMESSILFLLGKIFTTKVASILSVSDLPGNQKYDLLSSNEIHPDTENGINKAIEILIKSLPKIKQNL
jgi:purine-nucleoside phosphorylase